MTILTLIKVKSCIKSLILEPCIQNLITEFDMKFKLTKNKGYIQVYITIYTFYGKMGMY